MSVFVCEDGGGDSVRCWVGMCHRDTETLLISAHAHTAYTMGGRPPRFEVICDQRERLNVTSNALFCVLQVWQDFVRLVVLRLVSRSTNFHSSKQDGLVNYEIHALAVCFCFPFINFQAELLVFVEEHFVSLTATIGFCFLVELQKKDKEKDK